ncbi:hypothetical protein T492DRAFT_447520 [Pavlovales sp. CCMP2436]|nr:hypothetical protein T492DRAFT_447520 [Pavlovales sp. CCMP2436]
MLPLEMQLSAGGCHDSASQSVEEPQVEEFRDTRQDSRPPTPSVVSSVSRRSVLSSAAPGRMQEDCFQEALAAVSVMGDVNSDPTPSMSHADAFVLKAVEEVQAAVDTLLELPMLSLTPAAQHVPSPQKLPADAASDALPPHFRRQVTLQHTPLGIRRQSSRQTSARRGCAQRCGGELRRVAGALWHELKMLRLLVPSVLASCGHSEVARWRLWLMRPLYALLCARLLCVILFALARAPCVLDRAPLRYTVLVNSLAGWRACALVWLANMGYFATVKNPDQAAWKALAVGPDWEFLFGVHVWIASLAVSRALLELWLAGMSFFL